MTPGTVFVLVILPLLILAAAFVGFLRRKGRRP